MAVFCHSIVEAQYYYEFDWKDCKDFQDDWFDDKATDDEALYYRKCLNPPSLAPSTTPINMNEAVTPNMRPAGEQIFNSLSTFATCAECRLLTLVNHFFLQMWMSYLQHHQWHHQVSL